jgi:hypothetical protein
MPKLLPMRHAPRLRARRQLATARGASRGSARGTRLHASGAKSATVAVVSSVWKASRRPSRARARPDGAAAAGEPLPLAARLALAARLEGEGEAARAEAGSGALAAAGARGAGGGGGWAARRPVSQTYTQPSSEPQMMCWPLGLSRAPIWGWTARAF